MNDHQKQAEQKERKDIEFKLNEPNKLSIRKKISMSRKLSISPMVPRISSLRSPSLSNLNKKSFGIVDTSINQNAMEKLLVLQQQLGVESNLNNEKIENRNGVMKTDEIKLEKEDIESMESSGPSEKELNLQLNDDLINQISMLSNGKLNETEQIQDNNEKKQNKFENQSAFNSPSKKFNYYSHRYLCCFRLSRGIK